MRFPSLGLAKRHLQARLLAGSGDITVIWYSIVSILTSAAQGFGSFLGFRFLLGLGESANWPAATKAVSEWFPKKERALATAFFDSGSSLGGAIAPFLILPIYFRWGWRPAFVIPGLLGFIWLVGWRKLYHRRSIRASAKGSFNIFRTTGLNPEFNR